MVFCLRSLALLSLLVFGGTVQAEVNIDLNFKYIDIEANNPRDFLDKLRIVKSPVMGDAFAWIHSDTLNELSYTTTDQGCRLYSLDTDIDIVITLPRWTNVDERNEYQQKWWQRLSRFIAEHENAHKTIIIETAQALNEAAYKIPPQPDCISVKRQYLELKRKFAAEAKNRDFKLDFKDGGRVNLKDFLFLRALPDIKPEKQKPSESQ